MKHQGRSASLWRAGGTVVIAMVAALGLAGCTDGSTHSSREAGTPPTFGLEVDAESNLMIIAADGTLTPVLIADEPVPAYSGAVAVEVGDGRLAALGTDSLMLLNEDGVLSSTECAACSGLVLTDAGLVTAQQSFIPGIDFTLVTFDRTLKETARADAFFPPSRYAPSLMPKMRMPRVEASLDESVIVSVISATGGEAGNGRLYGPWVLSYYAPDGTLERYVEVPGHNGVGPVQISPDGEYSAVHQSTTSGACDFGEDIAIVDNRTARVWNPSASFSGDAVDGRGYLNILNSSWSGKEYVVDVIEKDPCAEDAGTNIRTVVSPSAGEGWTAESTDRSIVLGHLGETCDLPVTIPAGVTRYEATPSIGDHPLEPGSTIVYLPTPEGCRG
ncbi:MAG: hypothetical protein QM622_10410 [Microbacterium sp.]